jgi:hypothetical protein
LQELRKSVPHQEFKIVRRAADPKTAFMKKLGMLLLGVYLLIDGLLGFGLNLGPGIFLLYLVAIVAGVVIVIAALKEK